MLDFLGDYVILVIVGICLCVGYILKNAVRTDKINPFIPLIMGVLGLALNIWMSAEFTPAVVLGGLFSGLSSTGLYELFHQLINRGGD